LKKHVEALTKAMIETGATAGIPAVQSAFGA
jgi:hypothetical protein